MDVFSISHVNHYLFLLFFYWHYPSQSYTGKLLTEKRVVTSPLHVTGHPHSPFWALKRCPDPRKKKKQPQLKKVKWLQFNSITLQHSESRSSTLPRT